MLEVRQLSFSYGDRPVLHEISFSLQPGTLLSVLGMNGSGKSTLLKNLARLLRLQQGRCLLNGKELSLLSDSELSRTVAYLPQTVPLSDITVFEAVLIGRKPHLGWQIQPEDLQETIRMLDLTGLADYAGRKTTQLSGGELQRVAIARTLAQQPAVLLLDEPVNHLDIRSQIDVMDLIRNLTLQLGIATIAVMHDLNMALRFSDRFLLLKGGRMAAFGASDVITEQTIQDIYQLQVVLQQVGGLTVVVPCPDQEPSHRHQD